MFEPEFETSRSLVAVRASAPGVSCQIRECPFNTAIYSTSVVHQGPEHIAEDVVDTLGNGLGRHRDGLVAWRSEEPTAPLQRRPYAI